MINKWSIGIHATAVKWYENIGEFLLVPSHRYYYYHWGSLPLFVMEDNTKLLLEVNENKDALFPLPSSRTLWIPCTLRIPLLVGLPCPRAYLSVQARNGPQIPALFSQPHNSPHHSSYAVVMCSKQMVTSLRTKPAWPSQPLWLGARPGPGQTINPHLCNWLAAKGGPKPQAACWFTPWLGRRKWWRRCVGF